MIDILEFLVKSNALKKTGYALSNKDHDKLLTKPIKWKNVNIDIYHRKGSANVEKYERMSEEEYLFMFDYLAKILDKIKESSIKNIDKILYYNVGGHYGGFTIYKKSKYEDDNIGHLYYGGLKDVWSFSIHDDNYTTIEDKSEGDFDDIIYNLDKLLHQDY